MNADTESDPEAVAALQRAIYLEKVERARAMTVSERLSAGPELFEEAVGRMKIGVRIRHPEADEAEVDRLLRDQLDQVQAWKERDLYRPLPVES